MTKREIDKRMLADLVLNEISDKNLSTRELGNLCHLDHMVFQRLRKGILPSFDSLCSIAKCLKIDFIFDEETNHRLELIFNDFFNSFIIDNKNTKSDLYSSIIENKITISKCFCKHLYPLAMITYNVYSKFEVNEGDFLKIQTDLNYIYEEYHSFFYDIYGVYCASKKEYQKAISLYKKGLGVVIDPVFKASLYFHLSKSLILSNMFIQGIENAKLAYDIFNDLNISSRANHCLQLIAIVYSEHDDYNNAVNIYKQLLVSAKKEGDKKLYRDCFNNLLWIYLKCQDNEKIFELLDESKIELSGNLNDCFCFLGLLASDTYCDANEFDYWFKQFSNLDQASNLYQSMAKMLYHKNHLNYLEAIKEGETALEEISPGDEDENITILSTLSFCHKQLGNDEKALEYETMLNKLTSH